MNKIAAFFALGFGSGLAPKAPGTFGTLAAVPLYWFLQDLPLTTYLLICLVATVFGVWVCDAYSRQLGVHDHPSIVWDEVVGYLITMTFAPAGWQWIVTGFVLFRLFDIWKPWPINLLDKHVSGGFGIMVDDILAGIYAALGLWVLVQIL